MIKGHDLNNRAVTNEETRTDGRVETLTPVRDSQTEARRIYKTKYFVNPNKISYCRYLNSTEVPDLFTPADKKRVEERTKKEEK